MVFSSFHRLHVSAYCLVICSVLVFFPLQKANAWQGAGTKILRATSTFVVAQHAQESFGSGPDVPLTEPEVSSMCSLQKALPTNADNTLIEWLAKEMASTMGRDVAIVTSVLKDATFCESRKSVSVFRKADVIVHINSQGVVFSTNPVWNACVSGQNLTLELIRRNEDVYVHRQRLVSKNIAKSCRDYHRGDVSMWEHPDYPDLEIQLDAKGRLIGGLPIGYTTKKDTPKKNLVNR